MAAALLPWRIFLFDRAKSGQVTALIGSTGSGKINGGFPIAETNGRDKRKNHH